MQYRKYWVRSWDYFGSDVGFRPTVVDFGSEKVTVLAKFSFADFFFKVKFIEQECFSSISIESKFLWRNFCRFIFFIKCKRTFLDTKPFIEIDVMIVWKLLCLDVLVGLMWTDHTSDGTIQTGEMFETSWTLSKQKVFHESVGLVQCMEQRHECSFQHGNLH